jgi:hypothetical protein
MRAGLLDWRRPTLVTWVTAFPNSLLWVAAITSWASSFVSERYSVVKVQRLRSQTASYIPILAYFRKLSPTGLSKTYCLPLDHWLLVCSWGAAGAILFSTRDGNAPGARSARADRSWLWDAHASPFGYLVHPSDSRLGRPSGRARIGFYFSLPENPRPFRCSQHGWPSLKGVYNEFPSQINCFTLPGHRSPQTLSGHWGC